MSLAPSYKTGRKQIESLKGPICCILLLDYSNRSRWGMSVSFKGVYIGVYRTVNSFRSFNDECAIVKEVQGAKFVES